MSDDTKREAMIARIRALTQKTVANGCTEAEAQSAADAVDRLLAAYEVDLTELNVRQSEIILVEVAARDHYVRYAAGNIAKFTDARMWTQGKNLCFLALEVDGEIAEYLVMLFMRAIDRTAADYTLFNEEYAMRDRTGQSEMMHSFKVGLAGRLGERLLELKSKRDFTAKAVGNDLVVVKEPLIEAAFDTLGISISKQSLGRSIRDSGAYAAGRSAANGVNITPGVRGSASSAGKIR